ncbi:MAG: response regulator [Proteobacteria bacterium]|nr:response regulator [Pseudomonadota bacterium]
MGKKLNILVVSKKKPSLARLDKELSRALFQPHFVHLESLDVAAVKKIRLKLHIILCNADLDNFSIKEFPEHLQTLGGSAPIILLTEETSAKNLSAAFDAGFYDVVNPEADKRLAASIIHAVTQKELQTKLKKAQNEVRRDHETQEVLNKLLLLSIETSSITEILEKFINLVTSLPWMGLKSIGAALLVEDEPDVLVLKADKGLAPALHEICARVPFGTCLCGRAAQSSEVVFADCIDDRHDNQFEGIKPHGHYCVPIISADQELLGVFTLYTNEGSPRDQRAEDTLLAAAGVVAGIIKRIRAEDALRESEEKYRAITDTAKEAIIMIDGTSKITFWNNAATRIFGFSRKEAYGQNPHDLIVPKIYLHAYEDGFKNGYETFQKTGKGNFIGRTLELNAIKKDGTIFPVEFSVSSLKIGNKWGAVSVIRDITERKKRQEDTAILDARLRQAQKMEAVGTLAGGIAHDFNNILAAILGYAEMAKTDVNKNSRTWNDLDQVLIAANRAKDLVNQILLFSRQTEGLIIPVQIHLIIKEGLKLFASSLPPNIKLKQHIVDCGLISAAPEQIHLLLINLCSNAAQAMEETGGTIEVLLETAIITDKSEDVGKLVDPGEYIKLTVHDTGSGMDETTQTKIFEPYFTTKTVDEGTGLGLSVVHGIITSLEGTITVKSAPGTGTSFEIYLPSYKAEKNAEKTRTIPFIPRGTGHILYVDDEEALVLLSQTLLTKLGYTVSAYHDSTLALDAFKRNPDGFDLILTDFVMPELNGIEMIQEIRRFSPDIPVIMITGHREKIIKKDAQQAGIYHILTKPIKTTELAETIRQALELKKQEKTYGPDTHCR